ncbi:hypothetical protein [Ammoniphilus sp. CFH 90114]|uniref:aspartate/glutamate racemase family protein n=1 Tax=Ammoniphilus sp. CFH 90114 TaxID=2493665 RepID=UPI00100DEF2F|nr:hypothetical protein [Ammoniphilus sp. CFH 90114]RXT07147.1 hypothetical protein EIZ39_13445 [Ammoniphilus sp. CFH 90114]
MKIAFIHATTTAVDPIDQAFRKVAPEVSRLHFMDTGLLPMIQEKGSLTPSIINRFSRLVNLALESDVDGIQLTCSAFNEVTDVLQPLYDVKLFRSDEAMLDDALTYQKIGLISTVEETPAALISYLKRRKPEIEVHSLVNTEAFRFLLEGKQVEHDQRIMDMTATLEKRVDVIVLAQYSMAHVAGKIHTRIPILTAPEMSARRCVQYLNSDTDHL